MIIVWILVGCLACAIVIIIWLLLCALMGRACNDSVDELSRLIKNAQQGKGE